MCNFNLFQLQTYAHEGRFNTIAHHDTADIIRIQFQWPSGTCVARYKLYSTGSYTFDGHILPNFDFPRRGNDIT